MGKGIRNKFISVEAGICSSETIGSKLGIFEATSRTDIVLLDHPCFRIVSSIERALAHKQISEDCGFEYLLRLTLHFKPKILSQRLNILHILKNHYKEIEKNILQNGMMIKNIKI